MKVSLLSGRTLPASPKEPLLESLKKAAVYLNASCGGKGTCGKCKINVKSGPFKTLSTIKLTKEEVSRGYVLACQSYPEGDLLIEIPKESLLTVEGKIATGKAKDLHALLHSIVAEISPLTKRVFLELPPPSLDDNISDLERLKRGLLSSGMEHIRIPFRLLENLAKTLRDGKWKTTLCILDVKDCKEVINIFPGRKRTHRYGIAIDIGTTTIVVYIVDLINGNLLDIASIYNSQIRFGDDVITRIVHATEHNGLRDLKDTVITDINTLLAPLKESHHITTDCIDSLVVAGNTTMTHLFFGLDPSPIREEPYIPTANIFPLAFAGHLGIKVNPNAPVYALPCVASYVGGDIVSGVLASSLHKKSELCMFMDIGTNGEIVLGNSDWLVTAACSAGPCFEGSGIRHGMRATEGAIEDVRINPRTLEPEIKVIGGGKPVGICGSGMIDAIADMFLTGIIDQKGKLRPESGSKRIRSVEDGPEFVIYSEIGGGATQGKDIVLTEPDIENIIRAKAAIYAGLSILLKEVGYTFDDVQKVYIAGGFGNFLDIDKAIILGMLPDISREKFEFLGNTSIIGAYLCLLSKKMREEAEEIAKKMTYLELSVSRGFMDEYISGLFIPHTNIAAFPGVERLMKR
ncbi:MAG: DUF4445 domain-containing protein [Nitrospirae bacterium]|nr:DUF4445 domain-containing protein [Nitrospirota bacterium]